MNEARLRRGFTLLELLVVLAIMGIALSLLLSAVQQVRAAAARLRCSNNLAQMGLALHMYHDANKLLPPGVSGGARSIPYPYLGWQARLLPYVEQGSLWRLALDAYSLDRFPFDNPPHVGLSTVVRLYICPADGRLDTARRSRDITAAFTSYLGVEGTDLKHREGVLYVNSAVHFSDVTDGLSNTLMVGERPPSADFYYGWWYAGGGQDGSGSCDMVLGVRELNTGRPPELRHCPVGPYTFASGSLSDDCDLFHFWSLHPGGAHFLYADGSVHFLSYSADSVLPALATRNGGETVNSPE